MNGMEEDEMPSEEDEDDFRQRLPPLHVYLKRVLDKYPDGPQILKELLQNADDAGANKLVFLYDTTQHPTNHLWSQSLKEFNGPALYVYNDATFQRADWHNIQHPEQSGKHDDPTKVGRFGLGFISVYHLTDLPYVFSGTHVGILDPHDSHFTRDPLTGSIERGKYGKKWRISSKLLGPGLRDQFSPFISPIFDCDENDFNSGHYKGTIFRFPLRQEGTQSNVSSTTYDDSRVEELFQSFQDDAELSLLFLKNVESITIYEKKQSDTPPNLRFQIEVTKESRSQLCSEREGFIDECRNFHESVNTKMSRCNIRINTQLSQHCINTCNQYLIINILKRQGLSRDLQDLMVDEDLKLLPWVGVAAKTNPVTAKEGRAFCFLPLPESEHIHLPVHVHGYFGLGDNRRSIKWLDPEAMHDKKARWNQLLVEEVLPEVYVELIKYVIGQGMVATDVYKLWPQVNDLKGAWKQGMYQTISKLKEHPILHTNVGNGSWKTPAEVYINDITANSHLLQKVLLQQMCPVVQLPSHVLEALVWGKVSVDMVTPAVVRKAIRNDKLQWLTRAEKMQLLDYILTDEEYSDLEDVHLLPLRNGDFIPFSRNGKAVYVPSSKVPAYLFPNMDSGLTSKDCPTALTSSQTAISNYQLTKLTEAMVPSLLKECLPYDWVNGNGIVTWTPGSHHQPPRDWLKNLWIWFQQVSLSLHSFVSLPMIQVSTTGNTVQLARLQVDRLIFQTHTNWSTPTALSESVCTFLGSIGAVVIRHDLPTFIMQHREIKSFIKSGNGEGVMHILEALWNHADVPNKVQLSSASLRLDLAVVLSSIPLPAQWQKLLADIPIFKSSNGDFVSARQCPKGLPHGFHGVPLTKLRQRFMTLDRTSNLANKIGVQEVSLREFLVQYVFPDVKNHFYNQKECEKVMMWVLEKPLLDDIIKEEEFLPSSNGNFSTARQIFEPTPKLRSLFKDQPVFPTGSYAFPRMLLHLKRIGLRDESEISPQEILGIAKAVFQTQDSNRGLTLLKHICQYPSCLSSFVNTYTYNTLGAALQDIAWLPCESARPLSYPKSLPWFGKSNSLYCPKELKHVEKSNLLGSVAPIVRVEVCSEFSTFFGLTSNVDSESILDLVVNHLRNVIRSSHQEVQVKSVFEIVCAIYQYLGKISQDLILSHFSYGGIMAQEAWVWHGRGFTSPNKIAFSSVIPGGNLAPYLHVVPPELFQYKSMLGKLGVRQSFTIQDYIHVLVTLKKSHGSNPLDEKELAIVQDTIKAILTFGDLQQPIQSQIFVPDRNSMLHIVEELMYSDQLPDSPSEYIYTHHSITATQAKQLGIKTYRDIQLDQCSTDSGFEHPFGQAEKLTTRLRGILREYSHKPDVLKELLQNADDAGATQVHIVHDPRKHTGQHISGPEWEPLHSAPAICIYNDKPFTGQDIEGIQNVGVGGKISDTTTTGRFGIGFNAVYHLTDCPTFLTQNKTKLCIFDPHVKYVPRATQSRPGKLYYKEGNLGFLTVMPDMIEGYLQEFDQFDLEKGTMFRFPLRVPGMMSEISDECYDDHDVKNLLSEFEKVSREAVLFLKNIQKISISEIDPNTGNLKSRYQVTVDISEEGKKQRDKLAHHLRSNKDVDIGDIPQMTRVYALEIKDSTSKKEYEKWLVSQTIGLDPEIHHAHTNEMPAHFMTKSYLPIGGVAAPIHGDVKSGKAFCFLPLQIYTKLPVHVNGTFVLDQSRRNLKTGDNKDMIHPWNHLLAVGVIGPAYASLIREAGRILYRSSFLKYSDGQWLCRLYDRLFPTNLDSLQGVWELIGEATLRYIDKTSMEVLPVVKEGSTKQQISVTWYASKATVSNAYFDDLYTFDPPLTVGLRASSSIGGKEEKKSSIVRNFLRKTGFLLIEKKSSIVRKFLRKTGFLLISGSTSICKAFQKVKVEAEFISPEKCVEHTRESECITHNLPCHISKTAFETPAILKTVVDYCCSGNKQAVSDLRGLPFQLDGSDILDTFSRSDPKYLSFDHHLLPCMRHRFIHRQIIGSLFKCLSQDEILAKAYSEQVLKNFNIHELAKYIYTQLPPEWKGSTCHMKWSNNLPDPCWLKALWHFIYTNCKGECITQVEALADWPIIPTTSRHLVSINMAKTVLFLEKYNDTYERLELCQVLRKLGCPVVDIDKMERIPIASNLPTPSSSNQDLREILTRYLATPTDHCKVLCVIECMSSREDTPLSGRLTPNDCDRLLHYFQGSCGKLSAQDILQLKHLPLFPLATSHCRVSIHEAVHCHTYSDTECLPANTDDWMQTIGCLFLDYNIDLAKLYKKLEIESITITGIYMYLLPKLHLLRLESQLAHIENIKDVVLPTVSDEDQQELYDALKEIKFIVGGDGHPHEAAYYYDVENPVFDAMLDPSLFLSDKFKGDEWDFFLKQIGLQHAVTSPQFIQFAEEIEQSGKNCTSIQQYKELTEKSKILTKELKHNSKLYEPETLSKIAPIRFIPSVDIGAAKRDMYQQFLTTSRARQLKTFICFQDAVPETYEDLTWSVNELIPTHAVPKEVHEIHSKKYPREVIREIPIHGYLGIQSKPTVDKVLEHIRNVCNRMSEQNAHDKEDLLNKDTRNALVEVVTEMMDYLNDKVEKNEDDIKQGLHDTPICLVDEEVILTRANQLVFDMPKHVENHFRPYLYKAPRDLANYDKVLHLLGAQNETSFDQLAMVLKGISGVCKNSKMNVNDKNKAHAATRHLFQILQSTEGKCPITVHELYLPTPTDTLRLSTSLYYTDLGGIESIQLPSSDNMEFVIPLKQVLSYAEVYESSVTRNETGLIQLLPDKDPCNLRPRKLDTTERVLETNIACDDGMGHQCALVKQMRSLINSEDLQEILLRLTHHQMKHAPDAQQKEVISDLREFNNFLCVKELKTGFFDSSGILLGERKTSHDVFLAEHDSQEKTFTIHLSHTDISEYAASTSMIYLPLAQSISHICGLNLNPTHMSYLSWVLPDSSMDAKNKFLELHSIPTYDDLIGELGPLIERPGHIVPRDIWCLRDDDMSNKFHPGDMAMYKHPVEAGSGDAVDKLFYVYAKIIERLPMEYASEDEDDESLLRKYKIDIGGENPFVVSVGKVFMFRGHVNIDVHYESDDTAVTLFSEESVEAECLHLPSDFEDAKKKIRRDVSEAFQLPDNEKKECIHRLYRTWHPDKNTEQVLLATKAFHFLKQEIERLSGTSNEFEDNFSQWDFDIGRDNAEQQRYQQESSRRHYPSRGASFVPPSFTYQRLDPVKARLWYRQAEEDFQTAVEYHHKRIETSLAWPALMIQQSVEKALKAALFELEGSQGWSHYLDQLAGRVCQLDKAGEQKESLLHSVRDLVSLDCHATNTRYPEDGTNRTTGERYQDFNTMEALDLCKSILEMTKKIIGI